MLLAPFRGGLKHGSSLCTCKKERGNWFSENKASAQTFCWRWLLALVRFCVCVFFWCFFLVLFCPSLSASTSLSPLRPSVYSCIGWGLEWSFFPIPLPEPCHSVKPNPSQSVWKMLAHQFERFMLPYKMYDVMMFTSRLIVLFAHFYRGHREWCIPGQFPHTYTVLTLFFITTLRGTSNHE